MSHIYLTLYLVDFLVEEDFFAAGFFPFGEAPAAAFSGFFAADLLSTFFDAFSPGTSAGIAFPVSGFSTGSTFSTLRGSPGLPMKATDSREYCCRCPPLTRMRFFGLYLNRKTFSPRKCSTTVALI